MVVLSGLIVSIDAFFIGISLGLQRRCKFLYLAIINAFLFALCMLGYLLAGQLQLAFDPDILVGGVFIALGLWYIAYYFINRRKTETTKTIVLVGLVMSLEAMLITVGLTLILGSTLLIPLTVALAHFGYSALSFYLARAKYVKRLPAALSHVISGLALIAYGAMALFVEFGI